MPELPTVLMDERAFFGGQTARAALLAPHKLGFGGSQSGELLLPLALQAARDQTVFRINRSVAPLCACRFIAGSFDFQAPLPKRGVVVGFQSLGCGHRGTESGRSASGQERLGDRRINLLPTNGKAVAAAPIGELTGRAVVARCARAAAVIDRQPAGAAAARGLARPCSRAAPSRIAPPG